MNRLRLKRRTAARLLLAVFLPMLLLASVHRHEPAAAAHDYCEACVQHVTHYEQMAVGDFAMHDCVLCQLASLPFLAGVVVAALLFVCPQFSVLPSHADRLPSQQEGICQGRAPPRCF